MDEINMKLEKIIKDSNDELSIIIKRIDNNENIYVYKENEKIISASIIKVPIMLAVLNKLINNNISLETQIHIDKKIILKDTEVFETNQNTYSLKELLNWMIISSDNTATNILIEYVGMDYINEYIKEELKVKNTVLQRYMLDYNAINEGKNNYTNQMDMLIIFEKLFKKEILNEEYCEFAIQVLYNQRIKNQILRYVYEPCEFAHKTGSLEYLNHDVGVLKLNNKLFYIGISIYNCKSRIGNKRLSGILGKLIIDYLKEN